MPINIKAARANLARREERRKTAFLKLHARAEKDAQRIIRMIVKKYSPRRVYQWGSLLEKNEFRDYSDIDIAVEGIGSAERFFALFGDAENLTRFPLDLVELEKIDPLDADSIRRNGRLAYERK